MEFFSHICLKRWKWMKKRPAMAHSKSHTLVLYCQFSWINVNIGTLFNRLFSINPKCKIYLGIFIMLFLFVFTTISKYILRPLCIYYNLHVYTIIYIWILWYLCVYYDIYVYTIISMCILRYLCVYYNFNVYSVIYMCILRYLCVNYDLYVYTAFLFVL